MKNIIKKIAIFGGVFSVLLFAPINSVSVNKISLNNNSKNFNDQKKVDNKQFTNNNKIIYNDTNNNTDKTNNYISENGIIVNGNIPNSHKYANNNEFSPVYYDINDEFIPNKANNKPIGKYNSNSMTQTEEGLIGVQIFNNRYILVCTSYNGSIVWTYDFTYILKKNNLIGAKPSSISYFNTYKDDNKVRELKYLAMLVPTKKSIHILAFNITDTSEFGKNILTTFYNATQDFLINRKPLTKKPVNFFALRIINNVWSDFSSSKNSQNRYNCFGVFEQGSIITSSYIWTNKYGVATANQNIRFYQLSPLFNMITFAFETDNIQFDLPRFDYRSGVILLSASAKLFILDKNKVSLYMLAERRVVKITNENLLENGTYLDDISNIDTNIDYNSTLFLYNTTLIVRHHKSNFCFLNANYNSPYFRKPTREQEFPDEGYHRGNAIYLKSTTNKISLPLSKFYSIYNMNSDLSMQINKTKNENEIQLDIQFLNTVVQNNPSYCLVSHSYKLNTGDYSNPLSWINNWGWYYSLNPPYNIIQKRHDINLASYDISKNCYTLKAKNLDFMIDNYYFSPVDFNIYFKSIDFKNYTNDSKSDNLVLSYYAPYGKRNNLFLFDNIDQLKNKSDRWLNVKTCFNRNEFIFPAWKSFDNFHSNNYDLKYVVSGIKDFKNSSAKSNNEYLGYIRQLNKNNEIYYTTSIATWKQGISFQHDKPVEYNINYDYKTNDIINNKIIFNGNVKSFLDKYVLDSYLNLPNNKTRTTITNYYASSDKKKISLDYVISGSFYKKGKLINDSNQKQVFRININQNIGHGDFITNFMIKQKKNAFDILPSKFIINQANFMSYLDISGVVNNNIVDFKVIKFNDRYGTVDISFVVPNGIYAEDGTILETGATKTYTIYGFNSYKNQSKILLRSKPIKNMYASQVKEYLNNIENINNFFEIDYAKFYVIDPDSGKYVLSNDLEKINVIKSISFPDEINKSSSSLPISICFKNYVIFDGNKANVLDNYTQVYKIDNLLIEETQSYLWVWIGVSCAFSLIILIITLSLILIRKAKKHQNNIIDTKKMDKKPPISPNLNPHYLKFNSKLNQNNPSSRQIPYANKKPVLTNNPHLRPMQNHRLTNPNNIPVRSQDIKQQKPVNLTKIGSSLKK